MQKINHQTIILIDAHVHIHSCFDIDKFFDSSLLNFKKAAQKYFSTKNFIGVLFLTESSGENYFNFLKEEKELKEWKLSLTKEKNSIIAEKNEEDKLIIIAGRQIVTKEKLEVLALGIMNGIDDKNPINYVIKAISNSGGLAVIPWGVGKWIGKKRSIVKSLVKEKNSGLLYLGDNGNRPSFWPKSKIFKEAEDKNVFSIDGSDPLPFKTENTRAGSFGFAFNSLINFDEPFKSIVRYISNKQVKLYTYGKLETLVRFLRNQILMQISKRIK